MAKVADKDEGLKRLGGGRWQTRDERFTIEPQSGTWVVVDGEQSDDLGLPLVRGPFGSLRDAKAAIDGARGSKPAESPLAARAKELRGRPPARTPAKTPAERGKKAKRDEPEEPAEPRWLQDLAPDARRRARSLIDRLTEAGAPDPEGTARRDIVGEVPAVAAFAAVRALAGLGGDATPAAVARLLAEGRDAELGVRWRVVDGEGRPISLDLDAIDRA